MPLNRLKRNLTTQTLWIYILTLLKEKPKYAYEIPKEIKERFGFKIGKITSYVVLYRLEKANYVTKKTKETNGRVRKYYTLTKKGNNLLKEGIKFIENTLGKLNKKSKKRIMSAPQNLFLKVPKRNHNQKRAKLLALVKSKK